MKRRTAFTLIELLVVIGIIAVLISILLPTLSKARKAATRTACATQLREIAVACAAYAVDSRGYLPEYKGYVPPSKVGMMAQYVSYTPQESSMGNANDLNINANPPLIPDHGLGRLILRKYLSTPKILFCPAQTEITAIGDGGKHRPAYFFNPHPARCKPIPSKNITSDTLTTRYKKLKDYSRWRSLACDFFYDVASMPHNDHRKGEMQMNLVYADGHVSMPNSRDAYGRLRGAGSTDWDWRRVGDIIGTFEYLAEGKPVDPGLYGKWYYDPFDPPVDP